MNCVEPDCDSDEVLMTDFQDITLHRLQDMAWLCAEGYRHSQHLNPEKIRQMGVYLRQLERSCGVQRIAV